MPESRNIMARSDSDAPLVLDSRQLAQIEAVHRGFLYQHLYAMACLFTAARSGVLKLVVENDEDVEIALPESPYGANIRTSYMILLSNNIKDSLYVLCRTQYNPSISS